MSFERLLFTKLVVLYLPSTSTPYLKVVRTRVDILPTTPELPLGFLTQLKRRILLKSDLVTRDSDSILC